MGWERKRTDFVCSKQSGVHPSLFPVSLMLHHKSKAMQMCCFYLRSSPPCSLQYLRGSLQNAPTNLCEDALSHARPIYTIKATWWDPWGNEQREGQRREDGREKYKGVTGVRGKWGRGNRRRKTMRQNQKINEALFQWQDLCTVNITLAIRGNPITLCLFSPLLLVERE